MTVAYPGIEALAEVSLTLKPGETAALIGLSGSGKTTLLNTCNALIQPTNGAVSIDGKKFSEMSSQELRYARSRIGFIHQSLSLVPNLRVIQNVVSGRLGQRSFLGGARDLLFPSTNVVEKVYEVLDSVGIAEKIYERTDNAYENITHMFFNVGVEGADSTKGWEKMQSTFKGQKLLEGLGAASEHQNGGQLELISIHN